MRKNDIRGLVVVIIALIVFNVFSFFVPFEHTIGFWLGYGFGMLALVLQLPLLYLAFRKGETPRSRFYGFPIAQIGWIYFIVQFVLSVLGMTLGAIIPVWLIVLVYVVVLSVAAIGFIAVDAMRDEIERQDSVVEKNVSAMRDMQSKASTILGLCEGNQKEELKKLVEEIRYSDPVSNEETMESEAELDRLLNELQKALIDNNRDTVTSLCKRAMVLLAERNRLCKMSKR